MQIKVDVSNLFFTELEASGVTLNEVGGSRSLKIVVGDFEAQAIALGLEKIIPPRPLTHDFLISLLDCSDITLDKLVITDLKENTYYAEFYILKNGIETIIDTRPSDGIAVAVRLDLPIFVEEHVFEKVTSSDEIYSESSEIETTESLETKLITAVENEEYEVAAKLRDQLKKSLKKSN